MERGCLRGALVIVGYSKLTLVFVCFNRMIML
jgi:hypothetical protein